MWPGVKSRGKKPHSDKTPCAVGARPCMKMGPAWERAVNRLFSVDVEAIFMTEDIPRVGQVLLEGTEQSLVAKSRLSRDAFDLRNLCVPDISIVALKAGFKSPEGRVRGQKK
jgi:hypothetical protein